MSLKICDTIQPTFSFSNRTDPSLHLNPKPYVRAHGMSSSRTPTHLPPLPLPQQQQQPVHTKRFVLGGRDITEQIKNDPLAQRIIAQIHARTRGRTDYVVSDSENDASADDEKDELAELEADERLNHSDFVAPEDDDEASASAIGCDQHKEQQTTSRSLDTNKMCIVSGVVEKQTR